MKCPNCAAATLVHDTRDLPYACKGEATTIPAVTADWCPACGEAVMDVDESQRVSQAIKTFVRVEAAKRLAAPGAAQPDMPAIPRHRDDARK